MRHASAGSAFFQRQFHRADMVENAPPLSVLIAARFRPGNTQLSNIILVDVSPTVYQFVDFGKDCYSGGEYSL